MYRIPKRDDLENHINWFELFWSVSDLAGIRMWEIGNTETIRAHH